MNKLAPGGKSDHKWHLPLFESLQPLNWARAASNLTAGISLAAMNIPQAMGYTKIAGTPVVTGLYTLLLPLVAFAALGSSRYLVVAADSATAAILAGGLAHKAAAGSEQYVALAGLVALLAAVFLLLARFFRLGFLADFLSRTLLVGFLTGVGFQVGIAVLGEMLRLPVHSNQPLQQLFEVVMQLKQTHLPTLGVAAAVVATVLLFHRFAPRLPGSLIAVVAAVAGSVAFDFSGHGILTVGPFAGGLPRLILPPLQFSLILDLAPVAGACFVMILAQSSVTARAYAARHRQPLDTNRDLLGLSAANTAAALTGTFVVNGSPTQTSMVETSGGSSQLAHLSTAAVVMLVLLFLTGPLQYLPVCVLGAIVFTIAIHLVDVRGLRDLRAASPVEWRLALVTAASVVVLNVERGILLAMVLSLLDHLRHGYRPTTAVMLRDATDHWRMEDVAPGKIAEPGLVVYWFGADLYYANANHFAEQVRKLVADSPTPVKWLVADAGAITGVDYTAAGIVRELREDLAHQGATLAFAHVAPDFRAALDRMGLTAVIGVDRLFDTLRDCLASFHAEVSGNQ
jgi:MFS superfamily sulfate permease-like transporter